MSLFLYGLFFETAFQHYLDLDASRRGRERKVKNVFRRISADILHQKNVFHSREVKKNTIFENEKNTKKHNLWKFEKRKNEERRFFPLKLRKTPSYNQKHE